MLKKWSVKILLVLVIVIAIITALIFFQKDKIKNKAINGINEQLNAKVSVDGLIDITFIKTFPNITLELNQVFIEDKFNPKDTLVNLQKINFEINPLSIFSETLSIKSISLQNGVINLKTFKDGKSNFDILKKKKENSKGTNLNLEQILLQDIDLIYDDLKSKVYLKIFLGKASFSGKFYNKDFDLFVKLDSKAKKLQISNTTFLRNNEVSANFDLFYKAENKCISFKENDINIDGNDFNIVGDICLKENTINIQANAKGEKLDNALKLIPEDLFQLKGINGNGKYEISISISEALNKPKIQLDFNLDDGEANIEILDIKFSNIYASGTFKNFPKNNLVIKEFALKSDKTHLKGNIIIPNLKEKRMGLKLEGEIFASILEKINIKPIEFKEGKITLKEVVFNFNQRKQDSIWLATKFQGTLSLNGIKGYLNEIKEDFSIDGNLKFIQRKINIQELKLNIGENDIQFSGFVNNALNYFQNNIFKTNDALVVNGVLKSEFFNLNIFLKEKIKKGEDSKELNLLKWLNIESNIDVEINKFIYKKLEVNNIHSLIKSNETGLFSFKNFKANTLGGKTKGNIEFRFFNNKVLEVFIDAKLKRINITNLFNSFENFGQQTITDKNIKGNLNADIIVSMSFKEFVKFQKDNLLMQTNFKLKNGELIKLKSLQSLSKHLSVEQLEHIHFSNYKSSISIVNNLISLKNSKIKSNLISLKIGGTHSFSNQINYSIKLNLNSLLATKFKKKKTLNSDYVNNEKGGVDIFISMKGDAKNPTINMDRESAYKSLQKDLEKEKKNLQNLFKNDTEFFEEKNELYIEDDNDFIEFDNE